MRKGFTLIELLAVIVILAIIALIAVPIVINIINEAKTSSVERSVELYLDAVEKAIVKENLKRKFNPLECIVQTDGNLICDNDIENVLEIEMQGKKPTEGVITISSSKIENFKNLKFENNYVTKGEAGKYIVSNEKQARIIMFTYTNSDFQTNTYEVEEGMTWAEFIVSEYNSLGFYNMSTYVNIVGSAGSSSSVLRYKDNSKMVSPTDVINPEREYRFGDYYSYIDQNYSSCCFDAGTRVLMSDGTTKNIEDIQVGEYVMSYNEATGEFEPKKVLKTITKHHSDDLVYVNLSNGEKIGMRAYHPLLTTEGYKSLRPEFAQTIMETGVVEKLKVGDTLVGYESNVTITSIETRNPIDNYNTYNLTVEDNHNYIANGVVAHNAMC